MDEDELEARLRILQRAAIACKDGYFTKQELLKMQDLFGLMTKEKHEPIRHS